MKIDQDFADFEEGAAMAVRPFGMDDAEPASVEMYSSKNTDRDAQEPRSFEELLDAAKALEPGEIEDMEAIISECAVLNPMRADAVFRAIKESTKVPLGTIRAQLLQTRDATQEPDHLDLARLGVIAG